MLIRKTPRSARFDWTVGTTGIVLGAVMFVGSPSGHAKDDKDPAVPLPELTAREQARFEEGRVLFEFQFSPREGLGPVFNGRTCAACHHAPSIGGNGPGYRSNIRYHERNDPGTDAKLFHDKSISGGPSESIPEGVRLSERKPPTLQGDGLIAAIPEDAIVANEDPDDRDGDGIHGRAARKDGQLLRFGSQSQRGHLFEFVADALLNELGLTSPVPGFDQELVPLTSQLLAKLRAPQPNVTVDLVQKVRDFIALLAPPSRDQEAIGEPQVARGERLFGDLACAMCHVPTFKTVSQIPPASKPGDLQPFPALMDKEIHPFSDFLLHDVGETLDDHVALGVAKSSEYRTPPLWGVRFHQHLLMHDGRAHNFEQAIVFHGGEAARSRNKFLSLPADDRQALIEFLRTL